MDQPRLDDPFPGAEPFDIEAPAAVARCDADKMTLQSARIDHGGGDRMIGEPADDCASFPGVRQDEILRRYPVAAPGGQPG